MSSDPHQEVHTLACQTKSCFHDFQGNPLRLVVLHRKKSYTQYNISNTKVFQKHRFDCQPANGVILGRLDVA